MPRKVALFTQMISVKEPKVAGWHAEVERVYRSHGQRLWKSLVLFSGDPDLASDALSEAFAQALARGDSIRSLPAWVWRTAFRVAAGDLKSRRVHSGTLVEMPYEMADPFPEVIQHLLRLSPKQRSALILHYYAGYGIAETARIIDSTPTAVGVHLYRGRHRLRKIMEEDEDA